MFLYLGCVKKQGAVSHSTAEAEDISLDAGVRVTGLPGLYLWSLVIDVFEPNPKAKPSNAFTHKDTYDIQRQTYDTYGAIDFVPFSLPIRRGRAKLYALEDNDAVIKMVVKGHNPNLRHVASTHRVDLDWLLERISKDHGVYLKYVGTKEQLADILTKGSFTADSWSVLMKLCLIVPLSDWKYKDKTLKSLK